MHVLAIHMKVMMVDPRSPSNALTELWGALTCQWNKDSSGKLILRHNNVPLMMQDPLALMTHFILLLPLNVDLAFFKTVTRACFNLQLAQSLVRIAFTLSFSERSLLRGEYNDRLSGAMPKDPGSNPALENLGNLLGQVIDSLEATSLFSEEEDVIEMADDDYAAVMLDLHSLESEVARLLIPFLRTASLMKHYVYKEDLPDIKDDDDEFDQLVKFLNLVTTPRTGPISGSGYQETDEVPMEEEEDSLAGGASGSTPGAVTTPPHINISNVMEWFSPEGAELKMWCSEFASLACKDHIMLARQAMRVNVLWKQPQLLRLHRNFDQIFQVSLD